MTDSRKQAGNTDNKRQLIILIIGATLEAAVLIGLLMACVANWDPMPVAVYETDDPGDYGNLMGFEDDSKASQMFRELFPATLLPVFQNETYHYKARNAFDYGWACEIYLEFTIDDGQIFRDYIDSVAPMERFAAFSYDPDYLEYSLTEPEFFLGWQRTDRKRNVIPGEFWIDRADIEKVLIEPDEHRVIFWGFSVGKEGAFSTTSDFLFFFNRFRIDPAEFSETLDATIRQREIDEEKRREQAELIPDWIGSLADIVEKAGNAVDSVFWFLFDSSIGAVIDAVIP